MEKEDRREKGVGFLVHKDIVETAIGCRPISSTIITVQISFRYMHQHPAMTTVKFYSVIESLVNQTPNSKAAQGDWNAQVEYAQ